MKICRTQVALHNEFVYFNDSATTELYTLSVHDALPILCYDHHVEMKIGRTQVELHNELAETPLYACQERLSQLDRKSTRLNSSHGYISYAVFCLKKKINTA